MLSSHKWFILCWSSATYVHCTWYVAVPKCHHVIYKLDYTNHGAFNISAPEGYKSACTHNERHNGAMCLHEDYLWMQEFNDCI